MRKTLLTVMAALLLTACQETLEEKAAKEAEIYTKKNCPAHIADNLTMDSLTYEQQTRTLHYYYTITGAADSVGLLNPETARSALLTELKNTTSMMAYKEAGFAFAYTYHSQRHRGTVLYETVFKDKDYNQ
jgi:hypothetical protein